MMGPSLDLLLVVYMMSTFNLTEHQLSVLNVQNRQIMTE